MFVEYLFEVSPFTLGLIMLGLVFLVSVLTKKNVKEGKITYDEISVEYKKINSASNNTSNNNTFLVMSYNIMAHSFTRYDWFPYCRPEFLDTKYRAPRIINEIESVNPDILCLQECDHDLFMEFYKVNLEALGYNTIFKIASINRIVTNITAYKRSVFRQDSWEYLDLNQDLEKLDDSFAKHKEALIANLTHIQTGSKLSVVNTHLFWNPEFEYVKYGQISKILNYVEKSIKQNKTVEVPVILCGDLNSTPNSNVLRYIYREKPELGNIKGDLFKNKKYIEQFYRENMHSLNLRSAYDQYLEVGSLNKYAENHPDFTTYTEEFVGTLDYILHDQNLNLLELLKVPTINQDVLSQKLPNFRFPSDHLKIATKFEFKKN